MDVAALCGCFANLVNGDDVWMVERRGSFGLLLKAAQPVSIICKRSRQDFDGDLAVEPRVAGAPDFAHPARAEEGEDFVVAELPSDHRLRLLFGHLFSQYLDGWGGEKCLLLFVRGDQRLYLAAQEFITPAFSFEEFGALGTNKRQSLVIKLADSLVLLRRHGCFLSSTRGGARPAPDSNPGAPCQVKLSTLRPSLRYSSHRRNASRSPDFASDQERPRRSTRHRGRPDRGSERKSCLQPLTAKPEGRRLHAWRRGGYGQT